MAHVTRRTYLGPGWQKFQVRDRTMEHHKRSQIVVETCQLPARTRPCCRIKYGTCQAGPEHLPSHGRLFSVPRLHPSAFHVENALPFTTDIHFTCATKPNPTPLNPPNKTFHHMIPVSIGRFANKLSNFWRNVF